MVAIKSLCNSLLIINIDFKSASVNTLLIGSYFFQMLCTENYTMRLEAAATLTTVGLEL